MKIAPINTTQPNFNGKIIKKGHWTQELTNVFDTNPEVQKLIQGDKDIIAKMSSKLRSHYFEKPEETFKLKLISIPEKPTFMDKVKLFLGLLPHKNVTKNYHRSFRLNNLFDIRINAQRYAEELKINL